MIPDEGAAGRPEGLPSRARIAALVLTASQHRDSYDGWQHYRNNRGLLLPPPRLTVRQWRMLPEDRQMDYDLYRQLTNVNLPVQETPMLEKITRLLNRRLQGNALRRDSPTMPGVMVSGWGNYGKTATVCSVAAAFEDMWLDLHHHLNPTAIEGTVDLHTPVVYVQTPVTATPKSLCESILNFFGPERWKMTLPQLIRQVADSLRDHGVKALIIDDINRLRMHRADDQDVLDLIRALMSFNVTLVLTGVNIPGTGLLREATFNRKSRQWMLPPLESARVHGLEVTQIERRFELVELDSFHNTTPTEMKAFTDHLHGVEAHLRLLKAKEGMLTTGSMPEYLMRRTDGVIGLLGRLLEEGAQEAMITGKEMIDEALLDGIVIGRDTPADEAGPGLKPPRTNTGRATEKPKRKSRKPRNTVFDDKGPHSGKAAGERPESLEETG
ncbi:TniB family NTP-binding protein [Streptomyces sp. NPDC050636]|uniref:TniB family NTP-binding protein n=1 Tax=Streptomyces sp. NPDC050636 TaxID=3154510 RepID=UPI003436D48C